ncbi:tetratricopeptide repeat protein [Bdellovibrio bacteriovorus]
MLSCAALTPLAFTACAGKYSIKSYPSGAKVYIKDVQSQEKKLLGIAPLQVQEESKLGDVFFLIFEKQNYRTKEVMVKVNEGESLAVASRLEPLSDEEKKAEELAQNDDKKQDPQQPKPEDKKKPEEKKMDEMLAELQDLKLRVALLENTASFTKDALFSPRLAGGMPGAERDRGDRVVGHIFQGQQLIMKGQYDKAIEQIDKALMLDEYSNNAWLLKGSIKYLQKDFGGAKIAWERTLKLDPYNKVAYQYLSDVYKKLGMEPLPKSGAEMRYPASAVEIEKRNKVR